MKMLLRVVMFLMVFSCAGLASADSSGPVLRIGSTELRPDFKLYTNYSVNFGEEVSNSFNVSRAYIGFKLKFTPWLSSRVTYDLSPITDSSLEGSFLSRLKYGYISLNSQRANLSLRAGVIHTPWIDWIEHIEDTRFLRKVMIEQEYHYPSADFGVALVGSIGSYISYHLGVYNGEGYHGIEDTNFKDVIGRLSIRPAPNISGLEGLQLNLYGQFEIVHGDGHRRFGGALTYRLADEILNTECTKVNNELLAAWVQGFVGQEAGSTDSLGLSFGLRVEMPANLFLLQRVDMFDENIHSNINARTWTILTALGYRPLRNMTVALNYQNRIDGDSNPSVGIHTELRL